MHSIAMKIANLLKDMKEEVPESTKLKCVTFVPMHESTVDCDACKDSPVCCQRCIIGIFEAPQKESDDSNIA